MTPVHLAPPDASVGRLSEYTQRFLRLFPSTSLWLSVSLLWAMSHITSIVIRPRYLNRGLMLLFSFCSIYKRLNVSYTHSRSAASVATTSAARDVLRERTMIYSCWRSLFVGEAVFNERGSGMVPSQHIACRSRSVSKSQGTLNEGESAWRFAEGASSIQLPRLEAEERVR
jgi:hypothetical protein